MSTTSWRSVHELVLEVPFSFRVGGAGLSRSHRLLSLSAHQILART
jgi:hypothetical protein